MIGVGKHLEFDFELAGAASPNRQTPRIWCDPDAPRKNWFVSNERSPWPKHTEIRRSLFGPLAPEGIKSTETLNRTHPFLNHA